MFNYVSVKKISFLISFILMCLMFSGGCGRSSDVNSTSENTASEETTKDTSDTSTTPSEKNTDTATQDSKTVKVALLCENPENSGFSGPCVDKARALSESRDFELSILDCTNTLDWEENYKKAAADGADLIIGLGWSAADQARIEANNPENTATYALIDANGFSDNVCSIDYNSLEASYVMGVMAATAFPGDKLFGCISSFGAYYGEAFEEGLKSIDPEKSLKTELTSSYTDEGMARELAISMAEEGIHFIYFTAGACFGGIYDASLELAGNGQPIYTISQDTDETDSANPYIVSAQLKRTDKAVEKIINGYLDGNLEMGNHTEGLSEGSIGVVHVTDPGNYLNEEIITAEVKKTCLEAVNGIINGSIEIQADPDEQNEVIN